MKCFSIPSWHLRKFCLALRQPRKASLDYSHLLFDFGGYIGEWAELIADKFKNGLPNTQVQVYSFVSDAKKFYQEIKNN